MACMVIQSFRAQLLSPCAVSVPVLLCCNVLEHLIGPGIGVHDLPGPDSSCFKSHVYKGTDGEATELPCMF